MPFVVSPVGGAVVPVAGAAASVATAVTVAVLAGALDGDAFDAGRWLWRRVRRTPAARFARTLASHDAVAVLMHPNPDPDALASALAVARLAEAFGTDATLQYPGQIRHQENRELAASLDVELQRVTDVADLAAEAVVLVDHCQPRGFAGAGGLRPVAVVDHHPDEAAPTAVADVRPEYGACATILVEYLQELGYDPGDDEDGVLTERLATALLYGIHSDTNGFTRGAGRPDFDAGAYLSGAVDAGALDRIANPAVDPHALEVKARAVLERERRGANLVSDAGPVENVDAISQAADDLLRLEDVTTSVVLGDNDGTLYISGRTRNGDVHMGRVLNAAVEGIPKAEAGGHARMGGGQISLDHIREIGPGQGISRAKFRERLFELLAGCS